MADPKVVRYVKEQMEAGFTVKQIRKALLEADYTIEEANEAIEEATEAESESKKKAKKRVKKPAENEETQADENESVEDKTPKPKGSKPLIGFFLCLIGGIITLLMAITLSIQSDIVYSTNSIFYGTPVLGQSMLNIPVPQAVVLNIITGIGIILGSLLAFRNEDMKPIAGLGIIILSIISLLNGGAFFLATVSLLGGLLLLKGM